MKIVFAPNNNHKLEEIKDILGMEDVVERIVDLAAASSEPR